MVKNILKSTNLSTNEICLFVRYINKNIKANNSHQLQNRQHVRYLIQSNDCEQHI